MGAFADAAAEEALWLQLMRESAEHSPALADADLVAERAGTWRDAAVRQHTRTLLEAARRMGGAAGDAVTAGAGVVLGVLAVEPAGAPVEVGGTLPQRCRTEVADGDVQRIVGGDEFEGVSVAAAAQGVGGELGDHEGKGVGRPRGRSRFETLGEGAGDVTSMSDSGGAVTLTNHRCPGGLRARRLRVGPALLPRPGSVVSPGTACARRAGIHPGTSLFQVYLRQNCMHCL
ncbi:hypothetical protein [Streptomyces sp. NPDC004546]|uniref:hypothetical protein n=1 Tax=unclassified Streptomyces TaxID=2593676 RepID=UPI0033A4F262